MVKEAIDSVELEEYTAQFTGYEDRDPEGFLYAAYFGAPKRTLFKDANSRQVWTVALRHLKGRDVDPRWIGTSFRGAHI